MAAMRSALAMLGRRCGSSGSSAASSMGGRGLEIHQVLLPAAPRTPPLPSLRLASTRAAPPPQSLRPSAARCHGGLRRYSSENSGGGDKIKLLLMNENADNRLFRMREQMPSGVKTVLEADQCLLALVLFGLMVSSGYMMTELWHRQLLPFSGLRTRVPDVDYDNYEYEDGDEGDD